MNNYRAEWPAELEATNLLRTQEIGLATSYYVWGGLIPLENANVNDQKKNMKTNGNLDFRRASQS